MLWAYLIPSLMNTFSRLGSASATNSWNQNTPDWVKSVFGSIGKGWTDFFGGVGDAWKGFTGENNTDKVNSATAALQEDAQAFNAEEAQKQRDFESAEAQINRDWQEEMASTEKQRLVADYKAAGLNPWLAAGGAGGSVSAVGTASGDSASSGMGQAINSTKSGSELLAMAGITAASIIKIIKMLK